MLVIFAPQETIMKSSTRNENPELVLANKNARAAADGAFWPRCRDRTSGDRVRRAANTHAEIVRRGSLPQPARRRRRDAVSCRPGELCPAHTGHLPVYANTTAQPYPADETQARDLLAGQLARPVEFVAEIEQLYRDGVRTFVEAGPGAQG